ncbi:hypothetical protein [Spiroplasma endosymbiont of Stenodema calcarata]|uniref:hypothetical protein n=1 Tax=Spiroplasma endosymbiont of Stenodema calcarata TaxID=3139328 RepID=UPI003CCAC4A7
MRKIQTIISSLLVLGSTSTVLIPATSFIIQRNPHQQLYSATDSNGVDNYVYSGYLLRYFIYKSSNISTNRTVKTLEQNIVDNKDVIYSSRVDTDNVTMDNVDEFEKALMAAIVNISIYGMTNWKEFFAESYSKWTTTPDVMKNKSWEILNNFFVDIYPYFQSNNFGAKENTLKNSLAYINNYVANSKAPVAVYDITLTSKRTNVVDLKYQGTFGSRFGLQQEIPTDINLWGYSYTYNALRTSLTMWQTEGIEDVNNDIIDFNGNVLRNNIIDFNGNNLSAGLANMMNDSYTKASTTSLKKYDDFISKAKQMHYKSFDKLNDDLKKITTYETDDYQTGNTIFLKDSVTAMKNYYGWGENTVRDFEQQLLDLFNITYLITGDNFRYFLAGFLFSPDAPLAGQGQATEAYIAYSFYQNRITQQITSSAYAFIIFSAKGFDDNSQKGVSNEYKMGWWSSPNIFCSLNHEMGHAVDVYYGMTESARANAANQFDNILNSLGIKGQYNVNVFGFDNIVNYDKKTNVIKIVLISVFGVLCASIIIAIIWSTILRKTNRKKQN